MRQLLPKLLSADPGIEVVGTAVDGDFALEKVEHLRPDVVTLDLEMPRMDGFTVLRKLLRQHRLPVVIVSSLSRRGAEASLRALELGAVDVVAKPEGIASGRIGELAGELTARVRAAAALPAEHPLLTRPAVPHETPARQPKRRAVGSSGAGRLPRLVVIGVSTGGPYALAEMLPRLPADLPAAVAIVQHMPPGFTGPLAARLDALSPLDVREAAHGDLVVQGRVLVAPGDRHLTFRWTGTRLVAVLSSTPLVSGHRPSVDVLFASAAELMGARTIGVVMTGMGADGAEGLLAIRRAGGRTLAQDAASCVVDGMPRAAAARGAVERVVVLSDLATDITRLASAAPDADQVERV
jgi:two-component system chemotaxis response regulator CheB